MDEMIEIKGRNYPASYRIPDGHMRFAMVRYSDGSTGVGILASDTYHQPGLRMSLNEALNEKTEPVLSLIFASSVQARVLAHVLTTIAERMEGGDPHDTD